MNHYQKQTIDKILVVNAGSSSIKFRLFVFLDGQLDLLSNGAVEGIKTPKGTFTYSYLGKKQQFSAVFANHKLAIQQILNTLLKTNMIQKLSDVSVIGHRIVHGGTFFKEPTIVNQDVLKRLDSIKSLAPLHIPANLLAIKEFMKQTDAVNVAVFDTSFHSTIPLLNFIYPLPWSWYSDYHVRKYGFHGISYHYLRKRVSEILKIPASQMNGIICHLGNGASISAIKKGVAFDTSMGLTPLAGLMMGTRCGNIDPSVFQYIHQQTGWTIEEITNQLNTKSGFLGISKISSDLKDVEVAHLNGDKQATLAIDLFVKKIVDHIVVYFNALDAKLDYLVFSGGIGENSTLIVGKVLEKLKSLPLGKDWKLPTDRSWKQHNDHFFVLKDHLKVLIVQTNEELVICQLAISLLQSN